MNEYDIATLEAELRAAKIIDQNALRGDKINVGSKVTVKNTVTGAEMHLEIVGSMAADPLTGKVSNESPIGGALLGHAAGEVVPVNTPGGVIHLEVLEIH